MGMIENVCQILKDFDLEPEVVDNAIQVRYEMKHIVIRLEDKEDAESEEETRTDRWKLYALLTVIVIYLFLLQRTTVEPPSDEEKDSIAYCLVQLSWVTWQWHTVVAKRTHSLVRHHKAESPWHIGDTTDDF